MSCNLRRIWEDTVGESETLSAVLSKYISSLFTQLGINWQTLMLAIATLILAQAALVILEAIIHFRPREVYRDCVRGCLRLVKKIPFVRRKVNAELSKTAAQISEGFVKQTLFDCMDTIPREGLTLQQLDKLLAARHELDRKSVPVDRISGGIYHQENVAIEAALLAMKRNLLANPLHPDVFPGVRQMEAELISCVLRMFNADPKVAGGCVTSGGTESILMACRTAMEFARKTRGVTKPEMFLLSS